MCEGENRTAHLLICAFLHEGVWYQTRKVTDTYQSSGVTTGTMVSITTLAGDLVIESTDTCNFSTSSTGSDGGGALFSSETTYEDAVDTATDIYGAGNTICDAKDPVSATTMVPMGGDKGWAGIVPVTPAGVLLASTSRITGLSNLQINRLRYRFIASKDRAPFHVHWQVRRRDGSTGAPLDDGAPHDFQLGSGAWESGWYDLRSNPGETLAVESGCFVMPWLE
jgi:hypothetical protein